MSRFRQLFPWALVLLLLGWASRGAWPIVPVEGDDQGVLFGVEGMLRNDPALLGVRYLYDIQPGSYHLLATLARLTGVPAETIFGVATIAGAAAFILAAACLLRILFGWPVAWLLVVLLWCQELTTAAFYANTSAIAGGCALAAVVVAHRSSAAAWIGAGILLALAGWLRADSLLVAPACLGLAYWRERQWQPAFITTAVIATVATLGVIGLYLLSGTSPARALSMYAQRGYVLSDLRFLLVTSLSLLSPALALAGIAGLVLLLWRRQFALGFVMLAGATASLGAYGASLTTPKYFYYLTPFALIPALHLVDVLRPGLRPHPRLAALALAALALCDGGLGLRTLRPDQRYFTTAPTWATLGHAKVGGKKLALVVGPGELAPNADGFRLRTGILFAPACWHREKQRMLTDLAALRTRLAAGHNLTLYWSNWLACQVATRELFASGFRPREHPVETPGATLSGKWQRADQTVQLAYLGYVSSVYQPPGPAPASPTGTATYFIGDCANEKLTELADSLSWHLLSAVPEGFITLYQRR